MRSCSLPHTTARSLVYDWSTHCISWPITEKPAEIEQASLWLVNSVTCLSNMANISANEFSSSVKCVLEHFHIEKFRGTQQEAIVNLLEGEVVLVSQPTASEKFVIFIPSRSYASSMLLWWVWFTSCSLATSLLYSLIQDRARVVTSVGIQVSFMRVPYTFFVTREWAFLLCVKSEWGFIFSVIRESIYFRPRETGFRFFRDPWNMHLLSRDFLNQQRLQE